MDSGETRHLARIGWTHCSHQPQARARYHAVVAPGSTRPARGHHGLRPPLLGIIFFLKLGLELRRCLCLYPFFPDAPVAQLD